jgi:Zn-dependent protease
MNFQASDIALGAIWFAAFLFSTTVHEACHALVAWRLGDPTAYHGGQVSLNPWPHMRREPFGMVLMPLLSYAYGHWMIGWASAPYDPEWAARYPRRAGAMALAGPVGNLTMVALATVGIRVGMGAGVFTAPVRLRIDHLVAAAQGGTMEPIAALLSVFFSLNLILFLFNLLPVPPLDGAGVLLLLLPEELGRRWQTVIRHPLLALVGILVAWRLFPLVFMPLFSLGLRLLYPGP